MLSFRFRVDDALYLYVVFVFLVFVCLATGYRPLSVGTDTELYTVLYEEALYGQNASHKFEFLYDSFLRVFSFFSFRTEIFFSFLSALSLFFLVVTFFNINIYFGKPAGDVGVVVFGFLLLFSSVFFYSAQLNVVRQGISCFALFCFYSFILRRHYGFFLILSALFAVGFHSTAIIFIFLAVGLFFSYRTVFWTVFFVSIFYSLGLAPFLAKQISNLTGFDVYGKITEYGADADYISGVRYDFVLFSLVLGFFLDFLARFLVMPSRVELFMRFVKVYWLFLIPFFIFGFGAYSDRLLLNAWLYFSVVFGVFLAARFFYTSMAYFFGVILLFIVIVVYVFIAQGKLWM